MRTFLLYVCLIFFSTGVGLAQTMTTTRILTEDSSSPLVGGESGNVIMAFSVNKTLGGAADLTNLVINTSMNPNTVFSSVTLWSATNPGDFDDAVNTNASVVLNAGNITFTGNPANLHAFPAAAATQKFYIVATVVPGVPTTAAGTPSIQLSFSEANTTYSAGTETAFSITGGTFDFEALNAPVTQVTGGVASAVVAGDDNRAIIGFSAVTNGTQSLDDIVFTLDIDPTTGPLSGFQLVNNGASSVYSGGGTVLGTVPGLTATTVTFSNVNEALSGGPTYFFLIADVAPGATAGNFTTTLTSATADTGPTSGAGFSRGPVTISTLSTTITQLTGGVAASPLVSGSNNQAILGFSAVSNGSASLNAITFGLNPADNANPKISSVRLFESANGNFGGDAEIVDAGGYTVTVTNAAPFEIQITGLAQTLSPVARNYFLVVNVAPGVTPATVHLQPSLATAGVTLSGGSLSVVGDPITGTDYAFGYAQTSTITVDYAGQGSLVLTEYEHQGPIVVPAQREKVFGIDVTDADQDSHTTTITSLTLEIGDIASLDSIALFDVATSTTIPLVKRDVATNVDANNRITFPLNFIVPDGSGGTPSTRTIDVFVTFKPTVIDNDVISILVFDAAALNTGSGLAPLGTIQTTAGNNDIDVDATQLTFNSIDLTTPPNTAFTAVVWATDIHGNLDVNENDQVNITESGPGTGNITGGGFKNPVGGVYTFNALSINIAGSYLLTADDAGGGSTLAPVSETVAVNSLGVDITDGLTSNPFALNVCYGGNFQPMGSIKITETDPADFGTGGIFMLQLPSGFIFDTSVTPALLEAGNEVTFNPFATAAEYYVGNNIVRIRYTLSGTTDATLDAITISGLQVRYPLSTPNTSGNNFILVKDASATMVGNAETDMQNHGTLTASATPSVGYSFQVFSFPGQASVLPDETKFSYTTAGILLKPDTDNPVTTNNVFFGNGVSFSSTQNAYVFSPASVGVGNNYEVTFTGTNASGCQVSVTKTFQVYATSISGLLSEYCINDDNDQALSVDPSRYDISAYYAPWDAITVYPQFRRVSYNNKAYESLGAGNLGHVPPNTSYWKEVGYDFTGDYSISIPSSKNISSITNDGIGTITVTSVNHGFTNGTSLYLDYYVYDIFWNVTFSIPYQSYTISAVTPNTFDISYSNPSAGTYSNGYGYIYIQNPQISGVSRVANTITLTIPNHGLSNGVKVQVYIGGLSNNGVSNRIYDWFTVANATANTFEITSPTTVTGAWSGVGFVDILNYRISTFTPSMVTNLNANFGSITNVYVGFLVTQVGCVTSATNTCAPVIYSNEPVKLNQLALLDFTGLNPAYCANATSVTLTGNQTDGTFLGTGTTDGGPNNNTASFNPGSGSITTGIPFPITYSYTDNKNCTNTIVKNVVVNPTPTPPTPTQAQFGYCEGDDQALIIKVTGTGTDFAWYNNSSKTVLLGVGPVYDASSVGTGSPITQPFFATQFNAGCESNTAQVDLVVNALPSADFEILGQCALDTVFFTGPTTNVASWSWNFGDDNTSTDPNPINIFTDSKTYSVKLDIVSTTLTGNVVCQNSNVTNIFIGFNPDLKFGFQQICDGDNTIFTHTSSPPLDTVAWDFGDGTIIRGKTSNTITGVPNTSGTYGSPAHQYAGFGSYAASVIGETAIGCRDTVNRTVPILIKLNPNSTSPYLMRTANPMGEEGYWQVETTVDSTSTWEFNAPQGTVVNAPELMWVTNATGNYKSNDISYVNSPCFDLTGFSRPLISLQYMNDTQPGRDGAVMEYSTNSGLTWTRLGNPTTGLDWYNPNPVNALGNVFGWTESAVSTLKEGYHSLSNIPPGARDNVRFRIKFGSDQDTEGEGFAFNNVNIVEKNRLVLVENFTNSSKPETVNHNTIFRNLDTFISPSEFVPLEYHIVPAGFGEDPINKQNQQDNNARAAFYGITQNVTAAQDGMLTGTFNNIPSSTVLSGAFEDDFNLRSLRSSPVDLTIATSITAEQMLKVDVTVTALETIVSTAPVMVHIALVEKVVTDPDLAGQNGETQFKYVLRKMLPNAAGIRMTLPLNLSETFVASETIPVSDYLFSDISQMAIVAFVQNQDRNALGRREVWQSAIELNPLVPPIITGVEPSFGEQISIYPNPVQGELNIVLPRRTTVTAPISLTDNFGREVYLGQFNTGEEKKIVNTRDFAAGIYLLQIRSDKGETARKKVIVVNR